MKVKDGICGLLIGDALGVPVEFTQREEDAVLKAVNLGRDTDTVGAICGGLAGIYYGFDEIPKDWLDEIYKLDIVLELCEEYEAVIDEY